MALTVALVRNTCACMKGASSPETLPAKGAFHLTPGDFFGEYLGFVGVAYVYATPIDFSTARTALAKVLRGYAPLAGRARRDPQVRQLHAL